METTTQIQSRMRRKPRPVAFRVRKERTWGSGLGRSNGVPQMATAWRVTSPGAEATASSSRSAQARM
jgi:hypothetical protein